MHNLAFHCRVLVGAIALGTAVSAVTAPAAWAQTGLLEKLTGKPAEPVPPEQAFSVKARRVDATRIALDYAVRPGYYLYRARLTIALKDTPGVRIARIAYPPAVTKEDKTFGRSEVFTTPFVVTVQLDGNTKAATTLVATYQGCYEAIGVCYPPESKTLTIPPPR